MDPASEIAAVAEQYSGTAGTLAVLLAPGSADTAPVDSGIDSVDRHCRDTVEPAGFDTAAEPVAVPPVVAHLCLACSRKFAIRLNPRRPRRSPDCSSSAVAVAVAAAPVAAADRVESRSARHLEAAAERLAMVAAVVAVAVVLVPAPASPVAVLAIAEPVLPAVVARTAAARAGSAVAPRLLQGSSALAARVAVGSELADCPARVGPGLAQGFARAEPAEPEEQKLVLVPVPAKYWLVAPAVAPRPVQEPCCRGHLQPRQPEELDWQPLLAMPRVESLDWRVSIPRPEQGVENFLN